MYIENLTYKQLIEYIKNITSNSLNPEKEILTLTFSEHFPVTSNINFKIENKSFDIILNTPIIINPDSSDEYLIQTYNLKIEYIYKNKRSKAVRYYSNGF